MYAPVPTVTLPQMVTPGLRFTESPITQSWDTETFTLRMEWRPMRALQVTIADGARQVPAPISTCGPTYDVGCTSVQGTNRSPYRWCSVATTCRRTSLVPMAVR